MIRIFDVIGSLLGLILLSPVLLAVYILLFMETREPLFLQERLGQHKRVFRLVKFRTMLKDTETVATHLVAPKAITRIGSILRRTKLDELPQLWNVFIGDMSLVGPRPGLVNQAELAQYREKYDVFNVRPGITGLAQINKIDMSTPVELARVDAKMIESFDIRAYFYYIILTIFGYGQGDCIN
ncbi:MAG: sugar transferase [Pseudomonadota bacterium]|nr:sugar transferase [Pseudomonadota bacterium]